MKILTDLQKQLARIDISQQHAVTQYSFHGARTLGKFLEAVGYSKGVIEYIYPNGQFEQSIDYPFIKQYFENLRVNARLEDFIQTNKPSKDNKPYYETTENIPTTIDVEEQQVPAILEEVTPRIVVPTEKLPDIRISEDEYWSPSPPGQTAVLHPKQAEAAKRLTTGYLKGVPSFLLLAGTGTGKTYVIGSIAANLIWKKFHEGKTFSPWPYVLVTRASVVIQTRRVMEDEFGLDCVNILHVLNIEQLRSQFGSQFIEEKIIHEQGEPHRVWVWRKYIHPLVIFWDECQALKNEDSEQSKIAQAYNKIEESYNQK